ncbi:hypothetical protein Q5752_000724 [Cryptotrichosporon argae]
MAARPSTRAVGLAFERHAQRILNAGLGMALARVGGAGDGGVDLRGWWWLPKPGAGAGAGASAGSAAGPSTPTLTRGIDTPSSAGSSAGSTSSRPSEGGSELAKTPAPARKVSRASTKGLRRVRVVGQCKAERTRLGPRAVRELEGVMAHLRPLPRTQTAIAVLLSQSGFTQAAMLHASRSGAPMLLLHLPGGQVPAELERDSEPAGQSSSSLTRDALVAQSRESAKDGAEDDAETEHAADEHAEKEHAHARGTEFIVEGAWWNPPFARVLGDVELRREMRWRPDGTAAAGLGVWRAGARLARVGPAAPADD